jgi:hypothetical protein
MMISDYDQMYESYLEALEAKTAADAHFELCKAAFILFMKNNKRKTLVGGGKKFTLVARERPILNEEGLKKSLGAKKWNRLTMRVLDKKKLEAALESGEVDPMLVAQNSIVVEDKAFLKVSDYASE